MIYVRNGGNLSAHLGRLLILHIGLSILLMMKNGNEYSLCSVRCFYPRGYVLFVPGCEHSCVCLGNLQQYKLSN